MLDDVLLLVADYMVTRGLTADQAVSALEAMSDCVGAASGAKWMRARGVRRAGDIRKYTFRRHSVADYGKQGTLSRHAYDLRKSSGVPPTKNIAIAEYKIGDETFTKPFISAGRHNHSEVKAIRELAPQNATVRRVYSERSPCAECWEKLRKAEGFEDAELSYTVPHGNERLEKEWRDRIENRGPDDEIKDGVEDLLRGFKF